MEEVYKRIKGRAGKRPMGEKKSGEKLFGEYMEEMGICSAEQVQQALAYCQACSQRNTYLSIGQALVELGFTTQDKIEHVLQVQAKDRSALAAAPPKQEQEEEQSPVAEAEEEGPLPDMLRHMDILTTDQAEELGILTAEQIQQAADRCRECKNTKRYLSLGQALIELGYVTREQIVEAIRAGGKTAPGDDIARITQVVTDADEVAQLGERVQLLGLITAGQLEDVLGYWSDCDKRRRHISLAQALIELGYATEDRIEDIIAEDSNSDK